MPVSGIANGPPLFVARDRQLSVAQQAGNPRFATIGAMHERAGHIEHRFRPIDTGQLLDFIQCRVTPLAFKRQIDIAAHDFVKLKIDQKALDLRHHEAGHQQPGPHGRGKHPRQACAGGGERDHAASCARRN